MKTPRGHLGSRSRTRASAAALLLASVVLLAGCGGGSDSGDAASSDAQATSGGSGDSVGAEAPAAEADGAAGSPGALARTAVTQRAVIATATVSLDSTDVRRSRNEVQLIADTLGGEISDEEATTDDGELHWTRMVLRIPTESYESAIDRLEEAGRLLETSRSTEDVTTAVIDNDVRIRAQERSLKRVEILLDRAERLADVVNVESELTRRQAELDSLKQQQAWLADQTSMSTITVHIEQRHAAAKPKETDDGFLAGLATGWDTLSGAGRAASTVAGVLLPWLLALGLLGVPLGWALRRLGRAGAGGPRSEESPQSNG